MLVFRVNGLTVSRPGPNKEVVYVHLDKLVYVTGESIRYKVYTVDATMPGKKPCSKILYFTLTSTGDKSMVNWRINLQDNTASGHFIVPDNLKSGLYVLHAYTNWMRNGPPDDDYIQNLLIVNLSESTPANLMFFRPGVTTTEDPRTVKQSGVSLELRTSKSSYAANDLVQLEIFLHSDSQDSIRADLSVSVSAETPFKELLGQKDIVNAIPLLSELTIKDNNTDPGGSNPQEKTASSCLYRMEDKGFILTGQIKRRSDNAPLVNGKILLSVIDSLSPKIIYAQTDSGGGFLIYLSKIYDNKELILQLEDQSLRHDYYWDLDKKSREANHRTPVQYTLQKDEMDFLDASKNIRLIEAIYADQQVADQHEIVTAGASYFSPPDRVLYPGEYADLVNFKEMADNIIPEVKFTNRNNNFYLQVLNTRSVVWNDNKLILLNGVPFTDLAYISTLGTKDIKRIEVISSGFILGDMTLPGLVSFYTHDNKIPEAYIKNNTVTYENTVIKQDAVNKDTAERGKGTSGEHFPDFRNTLYWEPAVTITKNRNLVVEFPASRLSGIFTINVQGLTTEGHPVAATTTFEVKE